MLRMSERRVRTRCDFGTLQDTVRYVSEMIAIVGCKITCAPGGDLDGWRVTVVYEGDCDAVEIAAESMDSIYDLVRTERQLRMQFEATASISLAEPAHPVETV